MNAPTTFPTIDPDHLLHRAEVERRVGLRKSAIYERMAAGTSWEAGNFEAATGNGIVRLEGYSYRGLGLAPADDRSAGFNLFHLNTGHRLACLHCDLGRAFRLGSALAHTGDWDFLSLDGWKDRFPDLWDRLDEWFASDFFVIRAGEGDGPSTHSRKLAQRIAMNKG